LNIDQVHKFARSRLFVLQCVAKPSPQLSTMPKCKHMEVALQAVVDGFVADWVSVSEAYMLGYEVPVMLPVIYDKLR